MTEKSRSSRTINWLFSNPANGKNEVIPTTLSSDSLDRLVLWLVDWVATLEKRFKFRLEESTLEFWRVNYWPVFFPRHLTPFLSAVFSPGYEWYFRGLARGLPGYCKGREQIPSDSASCISMTLDKDWNQDHVHFLVTARENTKDTGQMTTGGRGHLSESPLHVIICTGVSIKSQHPPSRF